MKLQNLVYISIIIFCIASCNKNFNEIKEEKRAQTKSISDDLSHLNNLNEILNDTVLQIPDEFLKFEENSKGFCLVKGNSNKKQIAFTFDDGPTDVSIAVMKVLSKYDAKATFFWVGEKMEQNQKIIDMALNRGHMIANHSWDQPNGISFSNELLWNSQVEKCHLELAKHGIEDLQYYRPPFGAISQRQIDFLASKNIKTVLWSITTSDWDKTQNSAGLMFNKFKNEMHNGAIVLLHDFDFGNLDAKLLDLENMLKYAVQNNYKFVTIDELEL